MNHHTIHLPQSSSNGSYTPKLSVDGANGVGAGKLKAMLPFLGDSLDVTIVNDGTAEGDILNHQCGADFVKVRFPFFMYCWTYKRSERLMLRGPFLGRAGSTSHLIYLSNRVLLPRKHIL